MQGAGAPASTNAAPARQTPATAARAAMAAQQWGKVPRNAVCPCGSGKKFKHCHGKT
jgi:preprotein translocase subunit SecA